MRKAIILPAEYLRFGRYLWEQIAQSNPGDKSAQEVLGAAAYSLIGMRNDDGFVHELDIWASDRRDTGSSWGEFGEGIRTSWPEFFSDRPLRLKYEVKQERAALISTTTLLDLSDRLVEEQDVHSLTMLRHLNDQLVSAGIRGRELDLEDISEYLHIAAKLLTERHTPQEIKSTDIRHRLIDDRQYEPWKLAESDSLADEDLDNSLWHKRQSKDQLLLHSEYKTLARYLWQRVDLVDPQYTEETKALRDITYNLSKIFNDQGFMINLSLWVVDRKNKNGDKLKELWPEFF